jgi:hypothetical protein
MNTRNVSALFVAAALLASASVPLFATPPQVDIPTAFTVQTLIANSNGDMKVVRGMDRGDVAFAMKYKAREELAPDVWAYTGYHSDLKLVATRECNTIVITFVNGKVADLQLVNKPAVRVIALRLKAGATTRSFAAR